MNALKHDLRTTAAAATKAGPAPTNFWANSSEAFPRAPARLRRSLLQRTLEALVCWWRLRREIAHLSVYPDEMLKDIGVSRGGISSAVRDGRSERVREHGKPAVLPPLGWRLKRRAAGPAPLSTRVRGAGKMAGL